MKRALEGLVSETSTVNSIRDVFLCKTEIEDIDLVVSGHAEVEVLNISVVVVCLLVELLHAIEHCKCDSLDFGVSRRALLKMSEAIVNIILNVLHNDEALAVDHAVHNVSWGTSKPASAAILPVEKRFTEEVVLVGNVSCKLHGVVIAMVIAVEGHETLATLSQKPLKFILAKLELLWR